MSAMQLFKQTISMIQPPAFAVALAVFLFDGALLTSEFLPKPNYLQNGIENFGKSKFKEAIQDFNHVIESDPNNCIGYWGRGLTEKYLKQYPEAFHDLSTAIEKNPHVPDFYSLRADVCNRQENYKQAFEDINKAIAINPKDSQYYCIRSKTYSDTNQDALALKDANKALELEPNSYFAYRRRAYAKWHDCDLQGAFDDFNMVIKMDSTESINLKARDALKEEIDYFKKEGIPLESLRE